MWVYEKKLQYPVKIKNPNPQMAQVIMSQLGGPDGELGASLRYLNQRYSMPTDEIKGLLTDIGTEELVQHSYIYYALLQIVITICNPPSLTAGRHCVPLSASFIRPLPKPLCGFGGCYAACKAQRVVLCNRGQYINQKHLKGVIFLPVREPVFTRCHGSFSAFLHRVFVQNPCNTQSIPADFVL